MLIEYADRESRLDRRLEALQDARILVQSGTARAAIASFNALGGGWNEDRAHAVQDVAAVRRH